MRMFLVLGVFFGMLGSSAQAMDYVDLGDVDRLQCWSDSGRTVVHVNLHRGYYEITTIQDGYRYLHYRTRTNMRVQESFPASYIYAGRTTGKRYLSLGQTTRDMESFSRVGGTVHYTKFGRKYATRVTCRVYE